MSRWFLYLLFLSSSFYSILIYDNSELVRTVCPIKDLNVIRDIRDVCFPKTCYCPLSDEDYDYYKLIHDKCHYYLR